MYRSPKFTEKSEENLLSLMRENSFALLCTAGEGKPLGTHVPVLIEQRGAQILIRGHMAIGNPQVAAIRAAAEGMICFLGPHAYISPRHYLKQSPPTWNYQAVHAHVRLRIVDTEAGLEQMLRDLVQFYEPEYLPEMERLERSYLEGMLRAIVGFEAEVTELEGQFKLSQNKMPEERANIIAALAQSPDPLARKLGEVMQAREPQ